MHLKWVRGHTFGPWSLQGLQARFSSWIVRLPSASGAKPMAGTVAPKMAMVGMLNAEA